MIEDGKKVSVEYTLTLEDGTVADTNVGGQPLEYEQGSETILPALEKQIATMTAGDTKTVKLPAAQGYGELDPKKMMKVDKERVPEEGREVGQILTVSDPQGNQQPVRVADVQEAEVILDFNHPLAGQDLTFEVKVLDVN